MSDTVSKSWFCVFNNPEQHGYAGTPEEILERLKDEWILDHPTRTGAWIFCVSADGLEHVHMVLEDEKAMRFSASKSRMLSGCTLNPQKGIKNRQRTISISAASGRKKEKKLWHL